MKLKNIIQEFDATGVPNTIFKAFKSAGFSSISINDIKEVSNGLYHVTYKESSNPPSGFISLTRLQALESKLSSVSKSKLSVRGSGTKEVQFLIYT